MNTVIRVVAAVALFSFSTLLAAPALAEIPAEHGKPPVVTDAPEAPSATPEQPSEGGEEPASPTTAPGEEDPFAEPRMCGSEK
jgi:hypothetical protein